MAVSRRRRIEVNRSECGYTESSKRGMFSKEAEDLCNSGARIDCGKFYLIGDDGGLICISDSGAAGSSAEFNSGEEGRGGETRGDGIVGTFADGIEVGEGCAGGESCS